MFILLKLGQQWDTNKPNQKVLEDISERCLVSYKIDEVPIRFKVCVPTEQKLMFGDKLSLNIMLLDDKAVLYVIDIATHFRAATFLDAHGEKYGQSVQIIWLALATI